MLQIEGGDDGGDSETTSSVSTHQSYDNQCDDASQVKPGQIQECLVPLIAPHC
jgi:hypothetical protein